MTEQAERPDNEAYLWLESLIGSARFITLVQSTMLDDVREAMPEGSQSGRQAFGRATSRENDKEDGADSTPLPRFPQRLLNRFLLSVSANLEHYSLEFYLQRVHMALRCRHEAEKAEHQLNARLNPAEHPCCMARGFKRIVEKSSYSYEEFLADTSHAFSAIQSHLVSINRAFAAMYESMGAIPLSLFSIAGKKDIETLLLEIGSILIKARSAVHLLPYRRDPGERDLVHELMRGRTACKNLVQRVARSFSDHRIRLEARFASDIIRRQSHSQAYPGVQLPHVCHGASAGLCLSFFTECDAIALHCHEIFQWALRLYAFWYPLPHTYLDLVAPFNAPTSQSFI